MRREELKTRKVISGVLGIEIGTAQTAFQ